MKNLALAFVAIALLGALGMWGMHMRLAKRQAALRIDGATHLSNKIEWERIAEITRANLYQDVRTSRLRVTNAELDIRIAELEDGRGLAKAFQERALAQTRLSAAEMILQLEQDFHASSGQFLEYGEFEQHQADRLAGSVGDANRGLAMYSRWMYGFLAIAGLLVIVWAILSRPIVVTQAATPAP